jgi:hypothetical protein
MPQMAVTPSVDNKHRHAAPVHAALLRFFASGAAGIFLGTL